MYLDHIFPQIDAGAPHHDRRRGDGPDRQHSRCGQDPAGGKRFVQAGHVGDRQVDVRCGDVIALSPPPLDQPAGDQLGQRLADRDAADVIVLAEPLLRGQLLSG